MKYSIRLKLFAAMGSLIFLFTILSWVLNSLFLEKYYLHSQRASLISSFNTIQSLYSGDPDKLLLEMEKFENSRSFRIIIADKEFNIIYNSRSRGMNTDSRPFERPFSKNADNQDTILSVLKERGSQLLPGKPITEEGFDNRLNSHFIYLYANINDDAYIFISTPVAAIQASADIANKFFLFTGIVTILFGSILIFWLASNFTHPILELNNIAKSMSTLDFSRRYKVRTRDEIGHLGDSINSLSEQLQKSIMELREANSKLTEDIEKERQVDEMRKEFISNVSHELKTPIALVQGYAEGLKLNVNEDEENKNFYCDVIIDEALKMNRLVKQLLNLSQMESGNTSLDKSCFDICELIGSVIRKRSVIFKDRGICIGLVNMEGKIPVYADLEKIEQVVVNYLNNAINHVDENKMIRISLALQEGRVRITVFNSGRHIPEESLDKIWHSFYKVDKARTREYGGTGLGLSIVRAVQEAHGNAYGVRNIDGGVEFWFDLDISS